MAEKDEPAVPRRTPSSRVLVVVPAFNEAANVGAVVDAVRRSGHGVLVVDDGSRDHTAAVAKAHGATVLRLPINLGVGGALRCGFRYAVERGYEVVVQCDADGQHVAEEIETLLRTLSEQGAHLVVGSRFARSSEHGVGIGRRLVMRLMSSVASRRTGVRLTDTTSGFRAIREPLLSEFALTYPCQYLGDTFEALVNAGVSGYKIAEVPVLMRRRSTGESSATMGAAIRYVARAVLVVVLGGGKRIARLDHGRESLP